MIYWKSPRLFMSSNLNSRSRHCSDWSTVYHDTISLNSDNNAPSDIWQITSNAYILCVYLGWDYAISCKHPNDRVLLYPCTKWCILDRGPEGYIMHPPHSYKTMFFFWTLRVSTIRNKMLTVKIEGLTTDLQLFPKGTQKNSHLRMAGPAAA